MIVELDAATRDLCGNKAAALRELRGAGFPVPNGFVVTKAAFYDHCSRAFMAAELRVESTAQEKQRAILTTEISAELRHAFYTHWAGCDFRSAAVRSSSSIEDGKDASYAGQFETVLDVKNPAAAIEAVRSCWASLFSPHVEQYRQAKGSADGASMQVLVQDMVPAQLAGVAFSRDPSCSDSPVVYLEWVAGDGAKLVAGECISGRAWIHHNGDRVLQVHHLDDTQWPDPSVWPILCAYVSQAEELFGCPQDVEWAFDGTRILVLQSRPITGPAQTARGTPPAWLLPGRPPGGWNGRQRRLFDLWDEYNPASISPLDYDLYYKATWQATIEMLGAHRPALDVDAATVLYHGVPIAVNPAVPVGSHFGPPCKKATLTDWHRWMNQWQEERAHFLREFAQPRKLSDQALLIAIDRVSSSLRSAAIRRIHHMTWIEEEDVLTRQLTSLLGEEVDETHLARLLGTVDHDTHRMNTALSRLANELQRHGRSQHWQHEFSRFVEEFGHFSYGEYTLSDDPSMIERQISKLAEMPGVAETYGRGGVPASLTLRPMDEAIKTKLNELRAWIECRENSKTRQDWLRPLLNTLLEEAGRRLCSWRVIQDHHDVRLFQWSELHHALRFCSSVGEEELMIRRGTLKWKTRHSWLPQGFVDVPRRASPMLSGQPGSPGVARGRVRVVHDPSELAAVNTGEIVVAKSTNPLWTQVFGRIAGIVVENGSRLSHAAVVAREMQLPAVVSISGATDILQDGELVRIDGNMGTVERYAWENGATSSQCLS